MSCTTPKIGGNEYIRFGLLNVTIEGMERKSYVPIINENGTTEFGDVQEIKKFVDLNDISTTQLVSVNCGSDTYGIDRIPNPFTNNPKQYYALYTGIGQKPFSFIPSPYDEINEKNPIFFTENPDAEHPSCLLNMDGKGETAKILNQLAINLGNEDWKTGDTIPSYTSETLGWDKIAPAAQCCWMYCVDEKYKDNSIFGQGQWYLPTLGESAYVFGRYNIIENTIIHLQNKTARPNLNGMPDFLCSNVSNDDYKIGHLYQSYGFIGFGRRETLIHKIEAFCII